MKLNYQTKNYWLKKNYQVPTCTDSFWWALLIAPLEWMRFHTAELCAHMKTHVIGLTCISKFYALCLNSHVASRQANTDELTTSWSEWCRVFVSRRCSYASWQLWLQSRQWCWLDANVRRTVWFVKMWWTNLRSLFTESTQSRNNLTHCHLLS